MLPVATSSRLMTILGQEQSVFKVFSDYEELSDDCTAFVNPDSDEIPHWNMVYPEKFDHRYSRTELAGAKLFYQNRGRMPHLMLFGDRWRERATETSEYFHVDDRIGSGLPVMDISEFSTISDNDLDDFCQIVQVAFGVNDLTIAYFRKKMGMLSRREGTKFWIVSYNGRRCGCVSTFRTQDGSDFMFNFAVLPEFQGLNIGTRMLRYIIEHTSRPLYTYSHNPAMRESLLPNSGFVSVGEIHVVSLDVYLQVEGVNLNGTP